MRDSVGWAQLAVSVLAVACSLVGSWVLINNTITEVSAKVVELDRRVVSNENYDGILQDDSDHLKERVIRNEEGIKYLNGNLESLAKSMESIAQDIKQTNKNMNDFMLEQAKKD